MFVSVTWAFCQCSCHQATVCGYPRCLKMSLVCCERHDCVYFTGFKILQGCPIYTHKPSYCLKRRQNRIYYVLDKHNRAQRAKWGWSSGGKNYVHCSTVSSKNVTCTFNYTTFIGWICYVYRWTNKGGHFTISYQWERSILHCDSYFYLKWSEYLRVPPLSRRYVFVV